MTDFDLERLGDVWRQQPDPAELERLQRAAAAVSRRARLSQIVDIVAAMAVAGVVIALVLSNPRTEAFLMGAAAILVLLYSNYRQRKLRQVELRSLTGSTETMLQQSIERVETTLKHNRVSLIALGPALVIGVLFAFTVLERHGSLSVSIIPSEGALLWLVRGGIIAVLAGFALFVMIAVRRGRRELERLKAMREAYRHEHESTMG
jgi:hypothetical protein